MHLATLSILNDSKGFEKELELWDLYLRTMTKQGAFPLEAQRGAHAISYTAKSIMGLMKMAQITLYIHQRKENLIHLHLILMK